MLIRSEFDNTKPERTVFVESNEGVEKTKVEKPG